MLDLSNLAEVMRLWFGDYEKNDPANYLRKCRNYIAENQIDATKTLDAFLYHLPKLIEARAFEGANKDYTPNLKKISWHDPLSVPKLEACAQIIVNWYGVHPHFGWNLMPIDSARRVTVNSQKEAYAMIDMAYKLHQGV